MRPEHARFLKRGGHVVAPATAFDIDDTHGWSRAIYGDRWFCALVKGVVRRVRGTLVCVHWEDGTDIALQLEVLGLCGETLRRAQIELDEGAGPSTTPEGGFRLENLGRGGVKTASSDASDSDDDAPLLILRVP